MLEMLKRFWLLIAGAGTSITVSAAENIQAAKILVSSPTLLLTHPLLYYFLIGLAGASGGLVLKIIWGCIKRIFPKILKDIDK